nr:hypothetical protein [Lachnospiraceae bacterium]
MKGIFRRTLSFMLSATVLAGTMPMQSYGQELTAAGSLAGGQNVSQTGVPVSIADIGLGADVQILPVSIPEDLKDVSGGENTYLFIGSPQSDVSEKGKYAVTIYRRGNLDTETDFNFKSIDYSASYGEDYRIADDRYQTEIFETNGTLLKQGASPEGQKALEEVYNQVMSTTDETSEKYSSSSDDTSGGQASATGDTSGDQASAAGDTSTVTTASSAESKSSSEITASGSSAETDASSTEGKSLAELKQAQTGLPTRETDEEVEEMEDLGALTDMIVQNGVINMGDYTEISSATPIHFDAGEDYKTIVFEILEDDRSEGNEMIEFNIGEVSDGTVLAEPNVASVLIRDDEPLETSTVTFSQKTYRAENGEVTISVKREGADYSLATVVAKVEGEGDTGVKELYFQPYITEQTLELRFEPGEKERTYVIDLYDLKGCEEGEITSAKITVPSEADSQASSADSDSSLSSAGASFSEDTLEAVSGVPAEAGNTITVGGHVYVLAEGPDKNTMKIMSKENDQALGRKAQVQVGVYYKPQATDPWKWGLYHGDRPGSNNNYYDAANNFGNLRWYSRWVKDLGGLGGGFVTCMRPFAAYFLDYTSMSKYNSAQVSMTMQNADFGANYSEVNKSVFTGNRHNYSDGDLKVDSRALMGPIRVTKTTGGHFRKEGHSQFEDPGKVPDTKGTKTGLRINVDRTEAGFTEPEAHIYGVVAMYKSVSFSLDSPAPLKYKTATGGTVEEVPATVKLPDTARRFYGESITVDLEASDTDIKVPKGKLAAWEVTPNGGTKFTVKREDAVKKKIDYLSADGRTITINDNFIDMLTANGMTVDKSDLLKEGYVMKVTLKPVFEYVTVHVKVQAPTGKGTFKASDLSKMGEYQYHVGDTVSLEATPESGYSYAGYAMKTFRNYDDTNPLSSSELVKSPLNLKFGDSELYVINPVFTTQNNVIEVEMSSDAAKYFSVQGLVPDSELSSQLKGKKILKIDNRLSASDPVTQPVPGDAYEIRAVNTAANDGSYRPVFTIKKTGDKVNGYVVDMIAGASQSDNVVVVDAEKVKTADLRYFTLNTKAVYSSSKIRASDGTKNIEPAIGITVKAGGTHVAGYTSEHQKANMVIRSSAVTDTSGKFSIKGIYALPGDTVSVTFDNNDRQQVKYITLPKKVVPVKSTFETVVPNEQTVEMESKSITVDATEINIDQMGMPISSPRAPKIVKVDYSYDADPMRDTLKNFVELRPNEKVNFLAYVNAGSVSIKSVDFIIYDKKGAYRESSTKSITSPLQSGDKNCYKATFTALSELKEGDVLYIQVVSNESKTITYNNGAKSETEYKKYAMIDTGLTFGNVNVTDPPQSFSVEAGVGDYVAKFPFIGEIGRGMSANTGNLTYEKKLVDENNPMTSPFYMTYGMSFSTTIMKRQTDKLKEITNGKHVDATPQVLNVQEKVAATNLEAYANNVERDNLARIQAMADGDEKNSLLANWNSDVR